MRLRHIEVINAIRVTGTLSAAAELLNMTQPGVSQLLQSAERQLGYDLFTRSKGRLIPTREAATLFPEIERLDRQLDAVQKLADNLRQRRDDTLRILAAPSLAQTIVPEAVMLFKEKFPQVRISVASDYSASATISLALLEADVGIFYHSISHPAIQEQILGMSELVAVGASSVLPPASHIGLSQLASFELIGPDPTDPVGKLLTEALQAQSIQLDIRLTAQSYHSVVALAAISRGVGIVDAVTGLSAKAQGLEIVPIKPSIEIPIVASTATSGERSVLSQHFISACKKVVERRL
ncbi:LysR family transcriptional regulator [Herminiimonas sp. NPDC097707]|uniref:LysR family transcriptional regulator n=1 Tax=Herminiimonas sp. NPDC097707 TaxID=3364007 RepID=UPI00383A8831